MTVHSALLITRVLSCVIVAVVLLSLLHGRRRTTASNLLSLFALFALLLCISHIATTSSIIWRSEFAQLSVSLLLLIAVTASAIAIIWKLPRAIAFQDLKYVRSAARELRQSKSRFQHALDGSSSGLWEWNIESNVVWYSPRFRELLGYKSEDEFPNVIESWESALHRKDRDRVLAALNNHFENNHGFDVEYRLMTRAGRYRWYNARGLAIRDQFGRPYLMSGSIQDVHDRKLAEKQIRSRDKYLNQKQKMEALGEMAGATAHEFNNLLQAICGQIHIAERMLSNDSPAKSELQLASNLIEQSTHFTRQLLDFGRVNPTNPESFELNELVNNMVPVIHTLLGGEIELRLRLGKIAGPVTVNPASFQQVLLNLCINARDAMPGGGKLVLRTCTAEVGQDALDSCLGARPGTYAIISVSDTGSGMNDETKARVFEPFFTTKEVGKGTGLGLAVAHGVVKDCGGTIDIESSIGHGSTFTIWLPLTTEPSTFSTEPNCDLSHARHLRGATVLYAEDTDNVARAVAFALEQEGVRILIASDGLDAIRLFEEHESEIDVALLDLILPRIGGDEVVYAIRERRPDLPIVICSGSISQKMTDDLRAVPNLSFINKPFLANELMQTLDQALSHVPDSACASA